MTPPESNIPFGYCHCGCGQETLRVSKTTSNGPIGKKTRYKKGEPYRFRRGHANRVVLTPEDAIPFKIDGIYCRLIPLTKGYWAIVNASDYAWFMRWKWSVVIYKTGCYAVRSVFENGRTRAIFMHQMLGGKDHKNRNSLDNRRNNLRPATKKQNAQNRGPQTNNTSGYKGVHIDKRRNHWIAEIESDWIGRYPSATAAARAYDREAVRRFGEFAWLNFPEERSIHEQALLESN